MANEAENQSQQCYHCLIAKPLDEFHKHPQMPNGHRGKCKECKNQEARVRYKAQRDYERLRSFKYRQTEKGKARQLVNAKRHNSQHPEKYKARYRLRNAVRNGWLKKKPCETCGDPKAEAHHDDYSKPLNVRWLCLKHHREHHGRIVRP